MPPQGLGGNLYHTLTVDENIAFFADLFGLRGPPSRKDQIDRLLEATGLLSFRDRPAGKLSGGMKQKLGGLCCALIHSPPDLLILDEPTTGVDPPLSRKRFWDLIDTIRRQRSGMSVLVATATWKKPNVTTGWWPWTRARYWLQAHRQNSVSRPIPRRWTMLHRAVTRKPTGAGKRRYG